MHDPMPVTDWVTSSYSAGNAQCVETAATPGTMLVRDSKLGEASPRLTFGPTGWQHFTTQLKNNAS